MFWYFIGFVVFIIIYRFYLREPVFAWMCNYLFNVKSDFERGVKIEHFKTLSSVKSADPELREKNNIRLLEVGPGTGVNFEFFPEGTHLWIVDSNPSFLSYFNENKKKFENVICEKVITSKGEEMDMVPDNSCDVVVMTRVMCSVDSVDQIVRQIHRVLVPGGKFYFYEHVREYDGSNWKRLIAQYFLTYSGFWPLVFVGCMLTRDPYRTIENVGFKIIKSKKINVQFPQKAFYFAQPHLLGEAVK